MDLKNKKAFVLASSAGLGRASAEMLKREGATVCLNGRKEETLSKLVQEGVADHFVVGDLLKPGVPKESAEKAMSLMGGIDILVCNTGGPAKNDFLNVSNEQWATDFQGMWMSVVEALQVALPHMVKNKFGRVVLLTSITARKPLPGLTTSSGLRAGLDGLVRSLALEHSRNGITFNCIQTGYIRTDRLAALNIPKEKELQLTPMEHFGEPEDIANMVCFLASEKARYITAQSIAVDGGLSVS